MRAAACSASSVGSAQTLSARQSSKPRKPQKEPSTATGPNHQRFLDMLKGKVKPPSMAWKKAPMSERDGKYKPIPQADREARVAVLREQAAVLLSGDQA